MSYGENNNSYNGNQQNYNNNNPSIKWGWQDFPMSHLIKISTVFQERPKDYKSLFFSFFSVWPKGGDSYLKDESISFMLELPRLRALGKALRLAAHGALPQNNAFTNWADSSIAAVTGDNTEARKGKKFCIYSIPDGSVSLSFSRGKEAGPQSDKSKNYNEIPIKMHKVEALALADYVDFLADEGRKLDHDFKSQAPLHVIRKKTTQIHEARRKAREESNQQGGYQQSGYEQQGGQQGVQQQESQQGSHHQQNNQQQDQDQAKIMQAYSLPPLEGVLYGIVNAENGQFLKADGNVNSHLKALADAGFQYTEDVPYWWKVAA